MLTGFNIKLAASWKTKEVHVRLDAKQFCEMYLAPLCNNLLRRGEEKSKAWS